MRKSSQIRIAVLMLSTILCAALAQGEADKRQPNRSTVAQVNTPGSHNAKRAASPPAPEAFVPTPTPVAPELTPAKADTRSPDKSDAKQPSLSPAQSQNQVNVATVGTGDLFSQPVVFGSVFFAWLMPTVILFLIAAVAVIGLRLHKLRISLDRTNSKSSGTEPHVVEAIRASEAGQPVAGFAPQLEDSLEELKGRVSALSEELERFEREQPDKLKQIAGQFSQPPSEQSRPDDQDIRRAFTLIAQWFGQMQLREVNGKAATNHVEPETLSRLRHHLARIEPLEEHLRNLSAKWETQPPYPVEIAHRVHDLHCKIRLFFDWEKRLRPQPQTSTHMTAEDSAMVKQLLNQVVNRQLPITDFFVQYHALIQDLNEKAAASNPTNSAAVDDPAPEQLLADVPGYLMDWYDDFYQLYQSVIHSQTSTENAREELRLIRQQAQAAMARYEIQPEEIQLGETNFDGRLHELAYTRYSNNFPQNTVIGVQHCGFRHAHTGEALRRPQVVVSNGATAAGT